MLEALLHGAPRFAFEAHRHPCTAPPNAAVETAAQGVHSGGIEAAAPSRGGGPTWAGFEPTQLTDP
jgi:hypothetical protein